MILTKSKIYETRIIDLKLKDIFCITDLCKFLKKINLTTRKAEFSFNDQQGFINSFEKNYYKFAKYYGSFIEKIDRPYLITMFSLMTGTCNYKLIDTLHNSYYRFFVKSACKNLGNRTLKNYF